MENLSNDDIVLIASILFLFWCAASVQTSNAKSAFLYKFVPVALGIANLILLLKNLGYIVKI